MENGVCDGDVHHRPPLSIPVIPGMNFFIISHTSIETVNIVRNEDRKAAIPPKVESNPKTPL